MLFQGHTKWGTNEVRVQIQTLEQNLHSAIQFRAWMIWANDTWSQSSMVPACSCDFLEDSSLFRYQKVLFNLMGTMMILQEFIAPQNWHSQHLPTRRGCGRDEFAQRDLRQSRVSYPWEETDKCYWSLGSSYIFIGSDAIRQKNHDRVPKKNVHACSSNWDPVISHMLIVCFSHVHPIGTFSGSPEWEICLCQPQKTSRTETTGKHRTNKTGLTTAPQKILHVILMYSYYVYLHKSLNHTKTAGLEAFNNQTNYWI